MHFPFFRLKTDTILQAFPRCDARYFDPRGIHGAAAGPTKRSDLFLALEIILGIATGGVAAIGMELYRLASSHAQVAALRDVARAIIGGCIDTLSGKLLDEPFEQRDSRRTCMGKVVRISDVATLVEYDYCPPGPGIDSKMLQITVDGHTDVMLQSFHGIARRILEDAARYPEGWRFLDRGTPSTASPPAPLRALKAAFEGHEARLAEAAAKAKAEAAAKAKAEAQAKPACAGALRAQA